MNKYPIYYEGKKFSVEIYNSGESIAVYLIEDSNGFWNALKNLWYDGMLSKCTYIDSYFLRSVNDDDIFMAYRGGAGNYFSKPHLDDDYYINLCKMAVDTASDIMI